jgi:hypothetical protein
MTTAHEVQHVDFVMSGWQELDGSTFDNQKFDKITFRGALEYRPEDVVTEEGVTAYAVDMVRRYRNDLPADFWDQPLQFTWTVSMETRGDYEGTS